MSDINVRRLPVLLLICLLTMATSAAVPVAGLGLDSGSLGKNPAVQAHPSPLNRIQAHRRPTA